MGEINLETITDAQSWYKIQLLNEFDLIRAERKLLMETERSPEKPKVIYSDNSLDFGKACDEISWIHCASSPHRSETNGIAERAVRRKKEGTSAVLLHSGLDEKWWADSMECCCCLRNVKDLLGRWKHTVSKAIWRTI